MAIKLIPNARVDRNASEPCWHNGWKAVRDWNEKLCDMFVVFQNTENITYAVYYKTENGGELICSLKHADSALQISPSDSFYVKLLEVYRQEALYDGFPLHHPGMNGTIDTGVINYHARRALNSVERFTERFSTPFLSVRCGYGRIVASVGGDPGIYDDIHIDLIDDRGRELQLATVTCYESQDFDDGIKPELKVLAWNGRDEDCSLYQEVAVDEDSMWYE